MKRSIVSNYLLFCMGFGILMGCIFPVYASFFVEYNSALAKNLFIGGCLVAGSIVGGLSFLIGKLTILKAIRRATTLSNEIVNTRKLDREIVLESSDEIGVFANGFNALVKMLRDVILHSTNDSHHIDDSVSALQLTCAHTKEDVARLQTQTKRLEAIVEKGSLSVGGIQELLEQFVQAIGIVASSSEELSASVNEVSNQCRFQRDIASGAIKENAEERESVEELVLSSSKIGEISETIKVIASQTQLLALNASIEAASAGEAGKGFAVVANEIKELSKQTSDATVEIDELLQKTSKQIGEAVTRMDKNNNVIKDMAKSSGTINQSIDEQKSATEEIAMQLSTLSGQSEQIASNVSNIKEDISEIQKSAEVVNGVVTRTASNAENVEAQSEKLHQLVRTLESLLDQFETQKGGRVEDASPENVNSLFGQKSVSF